jgi:hypothetical protein
VLVAFILVVFINAPLHKFAPRHALRQNELAVVLLMTLASCGIPNWGSCACSRLRRSRRFTWARPTSASGPRSPA